MTAIIIIFGFGILCWAVFDVMAYALPIVVGISAGLAAYHSGAGVGAFLVAFVTGVLTFVAGQTAIRNSQSRAIRIAVALLFAIPAAALGAGSAYGLAQWLEVPSVVWQQVYGLFGAVVVGGAALIRVTGAHDSE
jgi:hypothetical protein